MNRSSVVAAVLLLLAQGQTFAQDASARWTVNDVVSRYTLGKTQKYVEFKIGSPAITETTDSIGIQRNQYEVGKCFVYLGIKNSEVVSVEMRATKGKCDLDVSDELHIGKPNKKMLTDTTFEDWSRLGELHFTDLGLPNCNACNESDIRVYGLIDAAGVNGMIELQVGGDYSASKGHDAWRNALSDHGIDVFNSDALPSTSRGCPLRNFDGLAFQLMKNAEIISIGYGRSGTLQPQCNSKTAQTIRSDNDVKPR